MPANPINIDLFKLEPEVSIWKTVKQLGNGGFGEVTLQERADGGMRALKKINGPQTPFLKRELETLIVVKKRPDLFVEFFGWYELKGDMHLALEYMSEGDLGKYLEVNGRQTEASTKEITKQILEGLSFLHEMRICHRDLKPENVLLASKSPVRVKLTDFGLSKSQDVSALHTLVGTQEYMSPELLGTLSGAQVTQGSYSTAVDMWALGSLVHKLYTMKTPFRPDPTSLSNPIEKHAHSSASVSTEDSTPDADSQELDLDLMIEYCKGERQFPADHLVQYEMSSRGIQFIRDLMVPYPAGRMTTTDAMQSRWMSNLPIDMSEIIHGQISELGVNLSLPDIEILVQQSEKAQQMKIIEYAPTISNNPGVLLGESGLKTLLRSYGVDVKKLDPTSRIKTPQALMFAAASAGNIKIVEMFFYLTPLKNEDGEEDGGLDFRINDRTMLQLAAQEGFTDIVKFLVQKGANVNALPGQQEGGRTALQAAAESGNTEIVNILLDAGADIEAKAYPRDGRGALQAAARGGNLQVVNILLERGADINMPPARYGGRTALQAASEGGHLELVRLFLGRGAKKNAKTSTIGGRTPMQAAAGSGHLKIVEFLLESGAKVNEEPSRQSGRTALQAAAEKGNLDIVKFLLQKGADVNAPPSDEEVLSALDYARAGGYMEMIELLEKSGAT